MDPERCAACLTWLLACPYGVPTFHREDMAMCIEAAACRGCGLTEGAE